MAAATARLVNPDFWRGRLILLTGHSWHKGEWAALWLARMGARVVGGLDRDSVLALRTSMG